MTDQSRISGIAADPHPAEDNRTAYDLNLVYATVDRGDVKVWFTWNRLTGEPCMVLTRNLAIISASRIIPCVIPLQSAWAWTEEVGDEHHAMGTAAIFCANIGFNPHNLRNVTRLVGIVRDLLGDLISMPPLPEDGKQVLADILHTDADTGSQKHVEVIGHA